MNGVYKTNIAYTAFIRVSGLKLWPLGDCNIVLFCFGAAPISKIAQLQAPRGHSFSQSLSWPYIFVYYGRLLYAQHSFLISLVIGFIRQVFAIETEFERICTLLNFEKTISAAFQGTANVRSLVKVCISPCKY